MLINFELTRETLLKCVTYKEKKNDVKFQVANMEKMYFEEVERIKTS